MIFLSKVTMNNRISEYQMQNKTFKILKISNKIDTDN